MKRIEVKTNKKSVLIMLVLVLLIVIMIIGIFARYMTGIVSEANGKIAVWHFDVKANGKELSSGEIEFEKTITCEENTVVTNKLAPGTSGVFKIDVDTSNTEVITQYDIKINLENCPKNLKFYFNNGGKREYIDKKRIKEENIGGEVISIDELIISRCVDVGEHKEHEEEIYWEWPFATGNSEDAIIENNIEDTNWVAKRKMTMNIIAIGRQVLEKPIYLADVAKIGDYVNYDANSNGIYTHTNADDYVGCTVQETFSTEEDVKWRVLSIDEKTKKVTLMAEEPIYKKENTTETNKVMLKGIEGYQNSENELNKIGSIYGHGKGAESARSINIDDIMQYSNFDSKTYSNDYSITGTVGGTRTYTKGKFIKGEIYKDESGREYKVVKGGIDNGDGTVTANINNQVTVIQTHYSTSNGTTTLNSFKDKNSENESDIYKMLFKRNGNGYKFNYWLASRCVDLSEQSALFYVRIVEYGYIHSYRVYYSNGAVYDLSWGVLPVVSLESNILTMDKKNIDGEWELK